NSAMDGYALRSQDTTSAPVELKVVGNLAAGYAPEGAIGRGECLRIMTGAPIPPGADAVVRFEDTESTAGGSLRLQKSVRKGDNIRLLGEDIRRAELVLERGRLLRPAEIGVLASLGRSQVLAYRRPRVAILATGDELVEIGEELGPGKIRNSNGYSNAALVSRYGGIPIILGIARDNVQDLTGKLAQALAAKADLILTSGGVSLGDFDMVKDVLNSQGQMHFWQVRMKPGKPLAFGEIGGVPLLGFPGNPVSAMVSFEQFARPAILTMLGKTKLRKPTVAAIAEEDMADSCRRSFIRVRMERRGERYYARPTGEQGSGILTSMARAEGLAIIPEGVGVVQAGEEVTVQMLDWPEVE
ncbi:MAG: molybdopterin molybdotransferase MoeA, partial [Chloroflexota bacterium]|nr:molybdopterin molybdotransferase MoeA [Chloroflexota bacterium]